MDPLDREVGGLRCRDVLDALPDFLDGAIDDALHARVLDHLAGCDRCERFGGEYGAVVSALRRELAIPRPAPERPFRATLDRIRDALH
jgi:anti-sigma factor RsiW